MAAVECKCNQCNGNKGSIWRAEQEARSLLNLLQARPGSPGHEWRKRRLVDLKAELRDRRELMAAHSRALNGVEA